MHGILSTGAPTNGEGSDVVGQIEIRGGMDYLGNLSALETLAIFCRLRIRAFSSLYMRTFNG